MEKHWKAFIYRNFLIVSVLCALLDSREWTIQRNMLKLTGIIEGPDDMVAKNIL